MSETSVRRAWDADRERAVVLLREHMVVGRLALEKFTERMDACVPEGWHDVICGIRSGASRELATP